MNWWKNLYLWATVTQADPWEEPELLVYRSPRWPRLRDDWLYLHPHCAVCETRCNLEVHHLKPIQFYPTLELDWLNLITLCRRCHFSFGHLLNWKAWNPNVLEDVKVWNRKIKNRKLVA